MHNHHRLVKIAWIGVLLVGALTLMRGLTPTFAGSLPALLRQDIPPTPFLYPPYYGESYVTSVFDHAYPRYTQETTIITDSNTYLVHYNGVKYGETNADVDANCRSNPCPLLVPSRPNPMAGVNGVAGGLDPQLVPQSPSQQLRNAAAQTSAQWDRIVVSWDKVEAETDDPEHPTAWYPERYDSVFAAETMPETLAILTHRFGVAVTLDEPCVLAVVNYLSRGEPLPTGYAEYHNHYYNCVRYRDYPYSYQEERILYQESTYEPPIVNGDVNPANDWAMFVYETVNRFQREEGPGANHIVDAWQIFNEYEAGFSADWCPSDWISDTTICGSDNRLTEQWFQEHPLFNDRLIPYLPPPRVYAEMVLDAAQVIHLVNPNAIVVLGGQWEEDLYLGNLAQDEDSLARNWYLSVLRQLEDSDYLDEIGALGLHAYGMPARSYEFMHSVYADPLSLFST